ncbi:MAG: DNA methyltransferase [Bryobacteraceae bacterium]
MPAASAVPATSLQPSTSIAAASTLCPQPTKKPECPIKDYGGHRKALNPLGLNLTDIWDDTSPARHSQFKARWGINELKPVMPARCIQISTNERDVVFDPFGGGGSTFESAEKLNRHWIGTEIVDCDLIRERFSRNLPSATQGVPLELAELFKESKPELRIPVPACQKSLKSKPSMGPKRLSTDLDLMNFSPKSAVL